jgi:hypothetical protein
MAVTSSRPSFLIFQFLSPILDTNSEVILSLKNRRFNFHSKLLKECITEISFTEFKKKAMLKFSITGAGRVAQMIEHLPSKCEVLSSNPPPPQKKKPKTTTKN